MVQVFFFVGSLFVCWTPHFQVVFWLIVPCVDWFGSEPHFFKPSPTFGHAKVVLAKAESFQDVFLNFRRSKMCSSASLSHSFGVGPWLVVASIGSAFPWF